MSSLISQPPPSIAVNGGGAPQGGDPDAASVVDLLRRALALLAQAATLEKDDADSAAIHKIGAAVSAQIAAEQTLTDRVMGAGPGVKMVRKVA